MARNTIVWILFLALRMRCYASDLPETVEAQLRQGRLEGIRQELNETRFFYSFRGIPYASPPIGDLRFKDPSPAESWPSVRKVFNAPSCPQYNLFAPLDDGIIVSGDEDCLYLNVYTPRLSSDKLPVMVFIHGGGFQVGNADLYGGTPGFLLREDVILVSIQYRLGALGFLSTGDSVLPGNLGLKDQTFALQWIHDNIDKFGGDKELVTVFGESAGSASAHYQIITPYSKGLVKRAILQSGTVLGPSALRNDHAKRAMVFAKHFNCPGAEGEPASIDSMELLQCFKDKSIEELVRAQALDVEGMFPFYMAPRIDGDYLPAHPAQLLQEGRYNKVDLISGIVQHEAAGFLMPFIETEKMTRDFVNDFEHIGPIMTYLDNEENSVYLAKRSFYHYVGDLNITKDNIESVQKLVADSTFVIAHDESTILHGRDRDFGKSIFRYELEHRAELSFVEFFPTALWEDATSKWVTHGDDLLYLFNNVAGMDYFNRKEDKFLSDIMVKLWTNFAKTGNPTPDMSLGFKWESMKSKDDMRYLSLRPSPFMKNDYRAPDREFWRNMPLKMNKILFPEGTTCSAQ